MPELPEVHTIVEQINNEIPFQVTSLSVSKFIRKLFHTDYEGLAQENFIKVQRYGKWMLFYGASSKKILVCSLGMSGSWIINHPEKKFKHTHLTFHGAGNKLLRYVDPRRFGHFYYYSPSEWEKKKTSLGIDPLSSDFTLSYFQKTLNRMPKRAIKVALLEQKFFPGIGNYLASEICAIAQVLPQRFIATLSVDEVTSLFKAIPKILHQSINLGGVSFGGGYQNAKGEKGGGKSKLIVFYQKFCQRCKTEKVTKIMLGARGTFYCTNCQK